EIKLELYEQILERFPESKHYPEALFMVGFVSAEEAADTLRALDAFQHFLSEYPQHEMATSAKMMIRDLQGEKTILEDVRSSGQE
ncbi:MAG: tetratricopeptide repeat protein, partial [Candidatus Eisenbacteria sp.]|nr:tetratricopeptide repeat protein [Candidatus Eisenbacteria bacterium]